MLSRELVRRTCVRHGVNHSAEFLKWANTCVIDNEEFKKVLFTKPYKACTATLMEFIGLRPGEVYYPERRIDGPHHPECSYRDELTAYARKRVDARTARELVARAFTQLQKCAAGTIKEPRAYLYRVVAAAIGNRLQVA